MENNQTTFKCSICNSEHKLTEMHYNPYTGERICDNCWPQYRELQMKGENK